MKLAKKDKIMLSLILVAILGYVFYSFFYAPLLTSKEKLTNDMAALQETSDNLDATLRKYNASVLASLQQEYAAVLEEHAEKFIDTSNDSDRVTLWNGTVAEFETNYTMLFYMINTYMPTSLGMVIGSGNVSISEYSISDAQQTATITISSFSVASVDALGIMLDEIARVKSLVCTSISFTPENT
jgi:hypothetical protein